MAEYKRKKGVQVSLRRSSEKSRLAEKQAAAARKKEEQALAAQRKAAEDQRKAEEARKKAEAAHREKVMNDRLKMETDRIPMKERPVRSSKPAKQPEKRYAKRPVRSDYDREPRFTVIKGGKGIKGRNRLILLSSILALVLILVIFSVSTPVGVSEYITNGAAKWGAGGGFPLELADDATKVVRQQDGLTTVVGSANFEVFNKNGKQILYRQHGFLNPALSMSESRFVIYDRGSTGYSINNMDKALYVGNLENKIHAAAIGRNGTVAFATASVEHKSQLSVMNAKCENVYNWYSADADLSAVAVSDNGRKVAAATMTATGGKFVSNLYIFDTKKNATLSTLTLDDTAVVSMERVSKNMFLVLCNNRAVLMNWKGEQLYTYQPVGTMKLCKVSDGHILFAESTTGGSGGYILTLVDKKGAQKASFSVSDSVKDVAYVGSAIYVLGDHSVNAYNLTGYLASSTQCDFSVTDLLSYDGGVLTVGFGEIGLVEPVSGSELKAAGVSSVE